MSLLTHALSGIINSKKKFCCLCLNSIKEEPIRLNDEIVVNLHGNEHDTDVGEVLSIVFNQEMYDYISEFNSLCDQCTASAISSYKFINSSQKTAEYLTNVLDRISNSFEYTTQELFDSKCMYVSLNLEDFSSNQYYDMTCSSSNTKAAFRRFRALDKTKNSKKNDAEPKPKKQRKKKVSIETLDLLFDKNKPELIKCKECLKVYPTIWNLRNHYVRVHAPKVFQCPECPRKYGSASFLENHKHESHCTVVCTVCGKTFNNRHTLRIHEIGHYLSLVCQDCGRVYKNNATFKKHIESNVCGKETRAHPSEAKYTCDYCNKKYTQKVSLRVHIQYEHGNYKSHDCKWCGKKFWAQSRLKAHIVKHTREKKFSCTLCKGKFVTKESLLYHTRTHTGEKPYKCSHCSYRFLSASRRLDHVKRHHSGATIECDICHSKFNTRALLLKHKKNHHFDNKFNLTYDNTSDSSNLKVMKPNNVDNNKSLTKYEPESKELWSINKVEDDAMPSFQKIIESSEVDLQEMTSEVYEDDTQKSSDPKVYLEVSYDTDDYIKIFSGC